MSRANDSTQSCGFRALALFCAIAFGLFTGPRSTRASEAEGEHHEKKTPAVSANDALRQLVEGNKRFVSGQLKHPHESREWRSTLETGQHPFAIILGCADSRVPPELLFDLGFGDLFVIRVAGNVVNTDVTASVEYAVDHLDTRLIVVLGHSHCGAVTAALDHLTESPTEPEEIVSLLYRIEPALEGLSEGLNREGKIGEAVKRNVELSAGRLSRVPDLMKSLKRERTRIVGGVYDMHTGKVEFLAH